MSRRAPAGHIGDTPLVEVVRVVQGRAVARLAASSLEEAMREAARWAQDLAPGVVGVVVSEPGERPYVYEVL